jgi:hypothetical protein
VVLVVLVDENDDVLIEAFFASFLVSTIFLEYRTVINIIEKSNSPSPRCTVTRIACNRSIITIAPRVIWPIAAQLAIIEAIFIGRGAIFDRKVKNIVTNTNSAVVAATDLWKYSIRNSFMGTNPAGQSGHLGQVSPTPEALT